MNTLFNEYTIKDMTLKNRIVMPPMCMYCAGKNGKVTDWHVEHYSARAAGQVGLIIIEATAISPEGRITENDLGIWSDDHVDGLKRIVDRVHSYGSKIGIQIAHAGRKSRIPDTEILSVTEEAFDDESRSPIKLDDSSINSIANKYKEATRRAYESGFDFIEIHAAHGYLLNVFLNPITNTRTDKWGGNREKRFKFVELIINSVREVWPKTKPLGLRLSAYDYVENGISTDDINYIVNKAKSIGIDIVNVSSGGVLNVAINAYPGYQVKLAERIKCSANIPVIAGGLIDSIELATEVVENNRADLIYIGRGLLRNPYWVVDATNKLGIDSFKQKQYIRAYR